VADQDAVLVAQVPDDARDVRCQLLLSVLCYTLDAGQAACAAAIVSALACVQVDVVLA